jgi:hypothetical protein
MPSFYLLAKIQRLCLPILLNDEIKIVIVGRITQQKRWRETVVKTISGHNNVCVLAEETWDIYLQSKLEELQVKAKGHEMNWLCKNNINNLKTFLQHMIEFSNALIL